MSHFTEVLVTDIRLRVYVPGQLWDNTKVNTGVQTTEELKNRIG